MYGHARAVCGSRRCKRSRELDPNVPPIEEMIARDRDLLITNPNPLPLGPDDHREPVAGPAEIWPVKSAPARYNASMSSFGLCSTNSLSGKRRGLTIAFDQLAARLPIMKSIPKSASLQ
jgi:hypothetical protein